MTDAPKPETQPPQAKVPPETLALRARPAPVTTINRKVLIGGAAVMLIMIAGVVLVALQPPTFRAPSSAELYNVDHKATPDGLAKLPTTYEGVQVPAPAAHTVPATGSKLQAAKADAGADAQNAEQDRLARMAGQAREAPVFFRLQVKAASREPASSEPRRDRGVSLRRLRPTPPSLHAS